MPMYAGNEGKEIGDALLVARRLCAGHALRRSRRSRISMPNGFGQHNCIVAGESSAALAVLQVTPDASPKFSGSNLAAFREMKRLTKHRA